MSKYDAWYKGEEGSHFLETIIQDTVKLERIKEITIENSDEKRELGKYEWITSKQMYEIVKERKIYSKYRIRSQMIQYINDDPVISINFHLLINLLNDMGLTKIINQYQLRDRVYSQANLKQVGEYCKRSGPKIGKHWFALVDVHTLYGWKNVEVDVWERVNNWVTKTFKPTYNGSETAYLDKFRKAVKKVLYYKSGKQNKKSSAQTFCANIASTGTTGSGFDPESKEKIEILSGDVQVKYKNNKYSKSAALSVENKMKRLFSDYTPKMNVNTKTEFYPKVRLIVASDFTLNLKMTFCDEWLKEWFSGNSLSTLWQDKEQAFQMWKDFCDYSEIKHNVPIDQSAFDHHVSIEMVQIINEVTRELIRDRCTDPKEYLQVMDTILSGMDNTEVLYNDPITGQLKKTKYRNGVLSGWKWTSYYDTVANVAERYVSEEILREHNINYKIKQFNAQGDDQLVSTDSISSSIAYWAALASCGFEVNLDKNFFSPKHNEYLRKYSEKNLVNGYPCRLINKMCWVYPGDAAPKLEELEKIKTTVANWIKLGERCFLDEKQISKYYKEDLYNQSLSRSLIDAYLNSDRLYGGSGLGTQEYKMETLPGEYLHKMDINNAPGYSDFVERFGEYQSREMENWFIDSVPLDTFDVDKRPVKTQATSGFSRKEELMTLPYAFMRGVKITKTRRIEGFPDNVLFGQGNEFIHKIFPDIDTYVNSVNAPRSWLYDFLLGRVSPIKPKLKGYSQEFSSMIFAPYENSIYSAMMRKRPTPNKWERLNKYTLDNFEAHWTKYNDTLRMY